MVSEEDVPPVIKTMVFFAAMIPYAVVSFETDLLGCVSLGLIYRSNDGHDIGMQVVEWLELRGRPCEGVNRKSGTLSVFGFNSGGRHISVLTGLSKSDPPFFG